MSYILDALKKSEKERQRGTVPDLLTVQDAIVQKQKKHLLWPYLLLIALLLNSGILLWWLVPWQSKKTSIVTQSTVEKQLELKALESVQKSEIPAAQLADVAQQKQSVHAKAALQRKVPSEPTPISPTVPKQIPATNHPPIEPQPSTDTGIAVEHRVFNLKDLPVSIRQNLPAFTISAHIYYSDPTSRMVKINGQMLREGQDLTAGLKLEEITQDGVILSYQNYRFRIELR